MYYTIFKYYIDLKHLSKSWKWHRLWFIQWLLVSNIYIPAPLHNPLVYQIQTEFFVKVRLSPRYKGGFRTTATTKMERFLIIVNGWKALTIITKCFTLDVAAVPDPPLRYIMEEYLDPQLYQYSFNTKPPYAPTHVYIMQSDWVSF